MVRLKAVNNGINHITIIEFQFQYGAIKRRSRAKDTAIHPLFQFQYGAIKSPEAIQ